MIETTVLITGAVENKLMFYIWTNKDNEIINKYYKLINSYLLETQNMELK